MLFFRPKTENRIKRLGAMTHMTKTMFGSLLLCASVFAQSAATPPIAQNREAASVSTTAALKSPPKSHYHPDRFAGRAGTYYRLIWGIDALSVKWAEAGEVIRFSYKVRDADKAQMLNDKKIEPLLIDQRAHVKLSVPQMDKIGKLRQSSTPEAGKTYWMLFSNKGGYVKRGDRVSVVIGNFRADGLVVDSGTAPNSQ
jgi:hypothetical protein